MINNATIKRGTMIVQTESGIYDILAKDIRVYARILQEDITVALFWYNGIEYSVSSYEVIWD